jgi:trimeric autotransporter adhesin
MRSLLTLPARALRRGLGALAVVALSGTVGCSFLTGVPDVKSVEVSLDATTIPAGTSALATCTIFGSHGSVVHSSRVICGYTSSNIAVATVNPTTGQITGVAPGTSVIEVSARGKKDTATITVTDAQPQRVQVDPPNLYLNEGPGKLLITMFDNHGQQLPARAVTVTSGNLNIITVDNQGTSDKVFLNPVTAGSTLITVTVGSTSVTTQVTVLPPRVAKVQAVLQKGSNTIVQTENAQVAVALFAADNSSISTTGQVITYQSDDPTIASVGSQSGIVTGVLPGTTNITVNVAGTQAKATFAVTVVPIPAREVRIQNRNPFARLGSNGTGVPSSRVAFAFDSLGRQIANRVITYRSTDPTVFQVSAVGTVVGQKLGSALLIASADNGTIADTISLTVTPVPVVSVQVNPPQATIAQGSTQQFTAQLTDSLGITVTGRPITWTSSNPVGMPVDANGLVTAANFGSATIAATVDIVPGLPGRVSGQAALVATPTPIATIDVTPSTVTVKAGGSTIVQIIPRDANGKQLFNRNGSINVSIDNPALVSADAQGNIRGLAVGTAHVTYQALDPNGAPQGAATVITVNVN